MAAVTARMIDRNFCDRTTSERDGIEIFSKLVRQDTGSSYETLRRTRASRMPMPWYPSQMPSFSIIVGDGSAPLVTLF
jgi:hypothetical protein